MQKWSWTVVVQPGTRAANEPWPQYARRRLGIERLGTYMRVILV